MTEERGQPRSGVEETEHDPAGATIGIGELEEILGQLQSIVSQAKSMPLSSSALISRDEALELIDAARSVLPEELRAARRMLKEREEFLVQSEREADEILEDARIQAEQMVQRTEIVRQAEHRATRVIELAESEARRMRREAEDFVDQRLAGFEIALTRTLDTVRAGRERLAAVPGFAIEESDEDSLPLPGESDEEDFPFDQDRG
jgi:cell division septum initiation protein DivIVA